MIFECPYCTQSVEIDNSWANETIECPNCHQPVIVPDPTAPVAESADSSESVAPRPPMHVPLQPLDPGSSKPLIKQRKGFGCAGLLFFLVVAAAGGFGYTMYRFHESPEQTWDRVTAYVRDL